MDHSTRSTQRQVEGGLSSIRCQWWHTCPQTITVSLPPTPHPPPTPAPSVAVCPYSGMRHRLDYVYRIYVQCTGLVHVLYELTVWRWVSVRVVGPPSGALRHQFPSTQSSSHLPNTPPLSRLCDRDQLNLALFTVCVWVTCCSSRDKDPIPIGIRTKPIPSSPASQRVHRY